MAALTSLGRDAPGLSARAPADRLTLGIFLICGGWAVFTAGVGWNNSLSDAHGFRQAQTAITTYYLMRGGPLLDYVTPVVGAPWSIPFEFPLYQWIVAAAARLLTTPLEQTGRFVSEAFFFLSLVVLWKILAELGVRPVHRLVFLTLLLVSPEYVFWSRTFLIESTAVFFGMVYLLFAVRYARTHKASDAGVGGIAGVLTALVKSTTFPGFAAVAALAYVLTSRRFSPGGGFRAALRSARHWTAVVAFAVLPVLSIGTWTLHADHVKALNTVGSHMTSGALVEFLSGPLRSRFAAGTWNVFFSRIIPDLLGSSIVLALAGLGLLAARHRFPAVGVSLLGFLLTFLAFTSAHVIHNYYAYANGVFLIAGVAWCVVGLLERTGWRQAVGLAIFSACVVSALAGYYHRFYGIQKTNALDLAGVAGAARRLTAPRDVILVLGQDWSSEIPFYSERRALMWPGWMAQDIDGAEMREARARLGEDHISAVILCNGAQKRAGLLRRARDSFGIAGNPEYEDRLCAVYTAAKSSWKER